MMKTGSKITGNNGGASGGGVYVSGGTFTMSGGIISGNSATGDGGGVFVMDGTFTKSGGVIYGPDADSDLKNTAGNGPAVYTYSGKKRISTADAGVTLNSGRDANWEYTVTFDADRGTPTTQSVVGYGGASLGTIPMEPSKTDCTFLGWYTAWNGGGTAFTTTTTVSADITAYAWWTLAFSLEEALDWLKTNAVANGNYTITVSADESIASNELSYDDKKVSVTLVAAAERTVRLNYFGTLFTIEDGVTLTMGNNVTLQGWDSNTASLVWVNSGEPW